MSEWSDVWSSIVTPYSEFVLTHIQVHTPGAVGSHIAAAPGEQLGVLCLAQVIEGGREHWSFTPPTDNSCWTWDSNPQPLGYKSDYLTIRQWLPPILLSTLASTNTLLKIKVPKWVFSCNAVEQSFLVPQRTFYFFFNSFCSLKNLLNLKGPFCS